MLQVHVNNDAELERVLDITVEDPRRVGWEVNGLRGHLTIGDTERNDVEITFLRTLGSRAFFRDLQAYCESALEWIEGKMCARCGEDYRLPGSTICRICAAERPAGDRPVKDVGDAVVETFQALGFSAAEIFPGCTVLAPGAPTESRVSAGGEW